jgi:transcriptional repressor NrdR
VAESPERERPTSAAGELVMNRLDKVAYVRFASVYLEFKGKEFMDELKDLLKARAR